VGFHSTAEKEVAGVKGIRCKHNGEFPFSENLDCRIDGRDDF
jgi:hypothetical protein